MSKSKAIEMEPPMHLQRPSSARSQDISHVLASVFREVFSRDVVGEETVKHLTTSRSGEEGYHDKYVRQLEEIQEECEKIHREADILEAHIMQAQASAMAADERDLQNALGECGQYQNLGLPPGKSNLRHCLDTQLLRKFNLIVPEDFTANGQLDARPPQADEIPHYARFTTSSHQRYRKTPPLTDYLDDRVESSLGYPFTAASKPATTERKTKEISSPATTHTKMSKAIWKNSMKPSQRQIEREDLKKLKSKAEYKRNPRFVPPLTADLIQGTTKTKVVKEPKESATSSVALVFIATPSPVVFSEYKVGETYELMVELKNVTSSSRQIRIVPPSTKYFSIGLVVVKVVFAAFHNKTIEFSSKQEVFVGEDAVFKWTLDENLANNIANVKFGVVSRPASHGERLDAILVRTLPSGKTKWNRQSSYVKAYVNRTEVIQNALAGFKILNVQLNDTSEYYCTVRKTGESQTMITDYVKLKVIDIEILNETSSQDIISWKGHKIRLHCSIRIIPNTHKKFTWRNIGTDGTVVDPLKQRDTINGSTLTIVTFKDTDFGPYECVARTPTTEQSHVIRIKRLYEPSEPGNFSHSRKLVKRINCTVIAKVSWMPPLQHGGAPVTHYIVEYKPFGREWSKASKHKVDTNHIKICRPPRDEGGEGLRVRVKAKNKVGVGKPSSATIVTFWDVPTAPLNLKYRLRRDLGEPFVELSWAYPLHDGGVAVSMYKVEYIPIGGSWSTAADLQTVEKQINVWKSSHDEDVYNVRVSAYNGVGQGEKSSILKVAFAEEVPSKPLDVVEKTVLHVKQVPPHIHITWRRPLDNGGLKITHYRVEYKIVTQEDWELAKSDIIVDEDYVIKDVDENQEYEVRVAAKNKIGLGSWSRPVVVRYKGKNLVASKARSQGSKLTLIGDGALALVFSLVTLLIIPLPG